MSNLESTRPGWIIRAFGVLWMGMAVGLTVADLITGSEIWPINLITLTCGFVNWHLGSKMIRRAREHRQFMERHRAKMAQLRGEPL